MESIQGKNAIVTGAGKGIGRAIAIALAQEGVNVGLLARTESDLQQVAEDLKQYQVQTSVVPVNVSNIEDVNAAVEKVKADLGAIDILINNAGIFEPKAFEEIPDEDWFRFFEVNVMSGIRLSRNLFPKMLKKNWGRIIFISSESAVFIPDEMIHYGMTKTAQLAVSRGLAELTKGSGVTVNSILPGPTKSEGVGSFIEDLAKSGNLTVGEVEADFFKNMRPTSLIKRFLDVQEIADTVTYYVSPLASGTNGAAIRVEGGLVRSIL